MEKELDIYEKILTGENLKQKSTESVIDEHKFMKEKMLIFKKKGIKMKK